MTRVVLFFLALTLPAAAHAQTGAGPEPKKAPDPKPAEKKDANVPPPPDLAALVAQPASEVRALARHYDADRGSLRRKYTIPTAPGQYERLRGFHAGWLVGLRK